MAESGRALPFPLECLLEIGISLIRSDGVGCDERIEEFPEDLVAFGGFEGSDDGLFDHDFAKLHVWFRGLEDYL